MTYRTFTQALEQGAVKFPDVDFSGYDKDAAIEVLTLAKSFLKDKIWVCHAITEAEWSIQPNEQLSKAEWLLLQERVGLEDAIAKSLPEGYTVVDTKEFEATFGADYEEVCKNEKDVDEVYLYRLAWIDYMIETLQQ